MIILIFFVFLADIAMDWSDHAMWWPAKNIWLDKTRWTLDQYNITADAIIYFTPMHKTLRIQLPDLRYIDCQVDFSVKTFNACVNLCKELGIRYPEELSLCKPLEPEHLKQNYQVSIYFFSLRKFFLLVKLMTTCEVASNTIRTSFFQETVMRRKPLPLTKEGNTGERIDTNTFILQNGEYSRSNGSLNGTLKSPRTPTTLQKNSKGYHSNPVCTYSVLYICAALFSIIILNDLNFNRP